MRERVLGSKFYLCTWVDAQTEATAQEGQEGDITVRWDQPLQQKCENRSLVATKTGTSPKMTGAKGTRELGGESENRGEKSKYR